MLMVYMPTAKCLGIDMNYNKPDIFESEDNFWIDFCEKVKIYKTYTKNMNENLRVGMNERSYNNLVVAKEGSASGEAVPQ